MFVDGQVAAVAGRIGAAQLDRLVAETIKRFDLAEADPAADPEDGYLHVDPRHATIHDDDVHFAGTMRLEAELDIADAIDVDRAVAHGAATQAALGSTESLAVRRAKALGDLARTQTALDLAGVGADPQHLPAAREVVLHAHFDATLDHLATVFGPTGRMEEGQRLVLLDQIRSWCGDSRTKITVKPVIDLNTHLSTPAYAVPDRIREQVILRDRTCVFPWCTRPARGCDIDHVIPHDPDAEAEGRPQSGPTQADNLAALCRFHHRLKTHTSWRYRMSPESSIGPARTAITTDATGPAPPQSTRAGHPTRPTFHDRADDYPAPHPATFPVAGHLLLSREWG